VLVDRQGRKLSKQNHAAPVDSRHAAANLATCLALLGQPPAQEITSEATAAELLQWAVERWEGRVPQQSAFTLESSGAAQHPGYNAAQQIEALPE